MLRDNGPFSTISGTCRRSKNSSRTEEESRDAVAAFESRQKLVVVHGFHCESFPYSRERHFYKLFGGL